MTDNRVSYTLISLVTGSHVPEFQGVVGGARQELCGFPIDIDTPDGTSVAVIRAQSFAVQRIPNIRRYILGGREQ